MTTQDQLERALTIYQTLKDMKDSGMDVSKSEIKKRWDLLLDEVMTVLEASIKR